MMPRRPGLLAARRRTFDLLVREVSDRSLEAVYRLVAPRVASMSLCEARGYIRARAAREIRRQSRLTLAQHPTADASWEAMLAMRAVDRVAPSALRQIISNRTRRGAAAETIGRRLGRAA